MSTSHRFYTLLLILLSGSTLVLAQPRPAARGSNNDIDLPGVVLSEISTFSKLEVPSYEVMPFGEDFFVATTIENTPGIGLYGSTSFNELRQLKLYRYSSTLKGRSDFQVGWPDEPREHIGIVSIGENFIWTFATRKAGEGEMDIAAEVLDAKGKLVSKHKLMSVERKNYGGLTTLAEYSASRKHYVRVYAEQSDNRVFSKRDDERATLNIVVFNEAGEAVANDRKLLKCNRDQLEVLSVAVDDEGKAYVLAKVLGNTRGNERRGASDADVYVYSLSPGAAEIEATELKILGQYIEGAALVASPTGGSPTVVGLYAERVNRRIRGFFASDDISAGATLRPIPFTQDMLRQMGPRITTRSGGELAIENEFVFRDALRLSDGRLSLLLESFRVMYTNSGPGLSGAAGVGMGAASRPTYFYSEGLLLNFSAAGQFDNLVVVPKYQRSQVPDVPYLRMDLVEYQGKAATIYNDNPKNFSRDLEQRTRALNLSDALAVIAYGQNGELVRAPIFARRDADKVLLIPRSAARLSDGSIIFLATRYKTFGKNELRFGLIEPRI